MQKQIASNTKNCKLPELLLPVGTREMLEAAVKNGADAVYFGVPNWNARGRTEDFTLKDVKDMISYGRLHGVKTYLAMNVLIFQQELEALPEYLGEVIACKPDGFIIQDIGLARLIRAISPNQQIHASTQMTLSSSPSVNLVKSIGFNRAVLARELSVKEIAAIKAETSLELEVFIHGALCVSYSGQCLTSENFGGRSGNRGQCAQSCRLPYGIFLDGKEFKNSKVPYLFSTRDLCGLPKLEELTQIGIESLKVEGRLKSPEYVAAVTKAYRKALNSIQCKQSNWSKNHLGLDPKDIEPLEVLFSRGLTTGWLDGDNHQEIVEGSFSNHHGLYLGKVLKVEKHKVWVELQCKLKEFILNLYPGDGILFENSILGISTGSRLYSFLLKGEILQLTFGRDFNTYKIEKNMKVYRNDSPTLEKELKKTFTQRNQEGTTPINIKLDASVGDFLKLKVWTSNSNSNTAIEIQGESLLETAKNPTHSEFIARKELSALSQTPYKLDKLTLDINGNPFIPEKSLRQLRQKAIQKLDEARLQWHDLKINVKSGYKLLESIQDKQKSNKVFTDEISVLVRNPNQIQALKGLDINNVIMDFDWGVKYDSPLKEIHDLGFKAGIATLRIHKPGENHYIKNILRLSPDFALVRNLGALSLLKDTGIPLKGDYSLNATNSLSYDWLLSQGLKALHPSWDLNSTELFELLKKIDGTKLELSLHQYMPAFHSEYCAFARVFTTGRRFPECSKFCTQHKVEIVDHKGEVHYLQSDAECRNTLFVGKPQSALKLLPQLKKSNVYQFRLELLQENGEELRKKVSHYIQAIRGQISIEDAIHKIGIEEKYGLTEGQLFKDSKWINRKK